MYGETNQKVNPTNFIPHGRYLFFPITDELTGEQDYLAISIANMERLAGSEFRSIFNKNPVVFFEKFIGGDAESIKKMQKGDGIRPRKATDAFNAWKGVPALIVRDEKLDAYQPSPEDLLLMYTQRADDERLTNTEI